MSIDYTRLYHEALEARKSSYSPYSHFAVGAALLCKDGSIYRGCNIENASFGATLCAERTAFGKAISEGHDDFAAIAIVGGKGEELQFCPPCGICRQFMTEFCSPEHFQVVLYQPDGTPCPYALREVLPLQFTSTDLD